MEHIALQKLGIWFQYPFLVQNDLVVLCFLTTVALVLIYKIYRP